MNDSNPALLSMNVLSGQQQRLVSDDMKSNGGQSMADQAYGKLMSLDAFDLVKGKEEQASSNPFDSSNSVAGKSNASLADMKKNSNVCTS